MKVAVFFSGKGSNLKVLIEKQNQYKYKVCTTLTDNSSAAGIAIAEAQGLLCTKIDYTNKQQAEASILEAMKEASPDIIVLAGFMRILSAESLVSLGIPVVNIHPSLLPLYKGLDTHKRVLEAGDASHGCSIHLVTAELDAGPILAQQAIEVGAEDTEITLKKRVQEVEHYLYPLILHKIALNELVLEQTE